MDLHYLTKSLRGNLRQLCGVCSVEEHEDLLKDILEKTPRLNKEEATKAVKKAFPGEEANLQSAFAASMISCVQSVFAKRKSMTSGRKLGAAWLRLISIVDDLYPLPSGSKVSSSSSKPSLPVFQNPVAKDVETKSKAEKAKRSLKKEDSAVTISSAVASEDDASQIETPPKAKVSELYDSKESKTEYVYYTDVGDGPPKKRQIVEIIGRDRLSRDAVTSIATQARDRLLAGESEAKVVQWAKEQSKQ